MRMKSKDMKRHENLLSTSSSRRENLHGISIGCMSGVFHLLCNYHSRRKSLTSGEKQEKNSAGSSAPTNTKAQELKYSVSATTQLRSSSQREESAKEANIRPRLPCGDVLRSRTLPAEMRRSNLRTPPTALVARLMGLDEKMVPNSLSFSAVEKRRQLLGALEKCDQDLKTLQKIIEAVKVVSADDKYKLNAINLHDPEANKFSLHKGCEGKIKQNTISCLELNINPTSVSMLQDFNPSTLTAYTKQCIHGGVAQQEKQQQKKRPGAEDITNICFSDGLWTESVHAWRGKVASCLWTSKAMVESVNEVCRDIAWGERREIARLGLALQDYICKDMIEETVRELGCYCTYSLPFDACKRRLCF